jgi:hypothetical protein
MSGQIIYLAAHIRRQRRKVRHQWLIALHAFAGPQFICDACAVIFGLAVAVTLAQFIDQCCQP